MPASVHRRTMESAPPRVHDSPSTPGPASVSLRRPVWPSQDQSTNARLSLTCLEMLFSVSHAAPSSAAATPAGSAGPGSGASRSRETPRRSARRPRDSSRTLGSSVTRDASPPENREVGGAACCHEGRVRGVPPGHRPEGVHDGVVQDPLDPAQLTSPTIENRRVHRGGSTRGGQGVTVLGRATEHPRGHRDQHPHGQGDGAHGEEGRSVEGNGVAGMVMPHEGHGHCDQCQGGHGGVAHLQEDAQREGGQVQPQRKDGVPGQPSADSAELRNRQRSQRHRQQEVPRPAVGGSSRMRRNQHRAGQGRSRGGPQAAKAEQGPQPQ